MINRVTLQGRIVSMGRLEYVKQGSKDVPVTHFVLYNIVQSRQKDIRHLQIFAYGRAAEELHLYFEYNDPILLEGRLQTASIKFKDGAPDFVYTKIVALKLYYHTLGQDGFPMVGSAKSASKNAARIARLKKSGTLKRRVHASEMRTSRMIDDTTVDTHDEQDDTH